MVMLRRLPWPVSDTESGMPLWAFILVCSFFIVTGGVTLGVFLGLWLSKVL